MRLLFVDAGNYCRSPAAQAVAAARAEARGLDVVVWSAGLKDKHLGDPPDPRTVEACAQRGYRLDAFRCREITPSDFAKADHILAMDGENLAALEKRKPALSAARLSLFLVTREVPDPYFGGADGFASMMDEIEVGVEALFARLGL